MTKTLALAALAAALAAPLAAETVHERDAASVLAQFGFTVDLDDLRLSQVLELAKIENADNRGQNPSITKNQIVAALSR